MSQNIFWKNVSPFGNYCSKFDQTIMKIRHQYIQMSKIILRGWRAWKNWFFSFTTFLAPAIFLIHDILKMDQKMTGAKKLIEVKNKLFHAHLPCEGIFEIHPYWGLIFWLFFQKFEQLFPNGETFFQKNFWLKSLQMVSSLTGLMCSEIWQP